MRFKLTKTQREKVSKIQSRVKEPGEFEKTRKVLYGWTVFLCLFLLPVKFLFLMGMDMKSTGFLCGFMMTGMLLLTSMVQPGTRTFWLLFGNSFIGLPLLAIFFPFDLLLDISDVFEAIFGLFPLWIPVVYLFYFTWKNIKLKKKHREQFVENAQSKKGIKLRKA